MFVAKYPDWTAAARFRDGAWAWYDGPKDLFTGLLRPERSRNGRLLADATEVWVKDYYRLAFVDARSAWFVAGSRITGPMGRELVAFAKEDDARAFMKDHGGQRLLRFAEVGPGLVKDLQ